MGLLKSAKSKKTPPVRKGKFIVIDGTDGSGKTTLFDIIDGETSPDSGQIVKRKDGTIGYLRQDINPTSKNRLLDEVESASREISEIAEKINGISVTGNGDLIGQLSKIFVPAKSGANK